MSGVYGSRCVDHVDGVCTSTAFSWNRVVNHSTPKSSMHVDFSVRRPGPKHMFIVSVSSHFLSLVRVSCYVYCRGGTVCRKRYLLLTAPPRGRNIRVLVLPRHGLCEDDIRGQLPLYFQSYNELEDSHSSHQDVFQRHVNCHLLPTL